eukprot:scaffold115137_cov75-Phaeocystis_antarctica.AAC.2
MAIQNALASQQRWSHGDGSVRNDGLGAQCRPASHDAFASWLLSSNGHGDCQRRTRVPCAARSGAVPQSST